MFDLLREDIMPSNHFGDAGMFPCRVGNDLQRSQVQGEGSLGVTNCLMDRSGVLGGTMGEEERWRESKIDVIGS